MLVSRNPALLGCFNFWADFRPCAPIAILCFAAAVLMTLPMALFWRVLRRRGQASWMCDEQRLPPFVGKLARG